MDFNVGEKVVHVHGGVLEIIGIKIMNYGNQEQKYFSLKSYYNNVRNNTLVIYVPEIKANDLLKHLMNKEEANIILNSFKDIVPIWKDNPKERKNYFQELINSKDINNACLLLKSIYIKKEALEKEGKNLKLKDLDFLKKAKIKVLEELAFVLNKSLDEIENEILDMIK